MCVLFKMAVKSKIIIIKNSRCYLNICNKTITLKQKSPPTSGGLFLLQKPTLMCLLYFVHELQGGTLVDLNEV
jgi:hypothetical protein